MIGRRTKSSTYPIGMLTILTIVTCFLTSASAYALECWPTYDGVVCNIGGNNEWQWATYVYDPYEYDQSGSGYSGSGEEGSSESETNSSIDGNNDGEIDCHKDLTAMPNAPVKDSFGFRYDPFAFADGMEGIGYQEFHNGIDYAVPTGTGVYAALNGSVAEMVNAYAVDGGKGTLRGNFVRVNYKDGTQGVYLHLKSVSVSVGDPVSVGQKLGTSNNTGKTTGAHLHYSLWKHQSGGQVSDPDNFHDPAQKYDTCS